MGPKVDMSMLTILIKPKLVRHDDGVGTACVQTPPLWIANVDHPQVTSASKKKILLGLKKLMQGKKVITC